MLRVRPKYKGVGDNHYELELEVMILGLLAMAVGKIIEIFGLGR